MFLAVCRVFVFLGGDSRLLARRSWCCAGQLLRLKGLTVVVVALRGGLLSETNFWKNLRLFGVFMLI